MKNKFDNIKVTDWFEQYKSQMSNKCIKFLQGLIERHQSCSELELAEESTLTLSYFENNLRKLKGVGPAIETEFRNILRITYFDLAEQYKLIPVEVDRDPKTCFVNWFMTYEDEAEGDWGFAECLGDVLHKHKHSIKGGYSKYIYACEEHITKMFFEGHFLEGQDVFLRTEYLETTGYWRLVKTHRQISIETISSPGEVWTYYTLDMVKLDKLHLYEGKIREGKEIWRVT